MPRPDSKTKSNAFFPKLSKTKKIHPALEYLRRLQTRPPTTQLENALSVFEKPKSIDELTFKEGVKQFIKLANTNPTTRKTLYGNSYVGLHYMNDLVCLWNSEHVSSKPIQAAVVSKLAPLGWDSTFQNGLFTLIYKGQQPAQALDVLVKGPTVIDCGMFSQLSIWFGIRYMLGNERFNQCFGRAPFFITQACYQSIKDPTKPYNGNPLYSFLSPKKASTFSVTVKHLSNTPLYPLKHPGGEYSGENCIVIGERYYIFDPHVENTQNITEASVLNLLREAFNQDRQAYDMDRLALYAQKPELFHLHHGKTCAQLIVEADKLRDTKLTEQEFSQIKQDPALELGFDLNRFANWLKLAEKGLLSSPDLPDYLPQSIDHTRLPPALLEVIPFENRKSMDFAHFKQETAQQKEFVATSKRFCHSVLTGISNLVVLTGKAGVGKTASAVCAAKELAARGKKVVWISEVMVNGWADKADSIADLDKCNQQISSLLATNPDAVFLDDDNLAGFSGNLLLETIYSWYVSRPGKGLFITSNRPIQFKECYGYKSDGKYHFPPFCHYDSIKYLSQQHKTNLVGESQRSQRIGQSIGAIVSDSAWKAQEGTIGCIELIPAFDDKEELIPIRQSLKEAGSYNCPAYKKLRPIQKQWLHVYKGGGDFVLDPRGGKSHFVKPFLTANTAKFESSAYKTIALEMRDHSYVFSGVQVHSNTMSQLIRVLNYAHDQGGRRIILINQTRFSSEELLQQIKKQLPDSERERTWSRLMLLLCETEDSIFKLTQFNGRIEDASPKPRLDQENPQHSKHSSEIKSVWTLFLTAIKNFFLSILSFFRKEKTSATQSATKPLQEVAKSASGVPLTRQHNKNRWKLISIDETQPGIGTRRFFQPEPSNDQHGVVRQQGPTF